MKKIIFYFSIILSVILLINVIQILVSDFQRLTEYGFGYLIGKIILLLISLFIIYLTKETNKLKN